MSFTKVDAEATAKKLSKKPRQSDYPRMEVKELKGGAHLIQQIWCQGRLIAKFGIKHGSNRNSSHGWVADELELPPRRMKEFAICSMSIDEMLEHFRERGYVELPGSDTTDDIDLEVRDEP